MVKEFLDQLNISKSCGPDGITSRLLKECSKSLSIPSAPWSINNWTAVVFRKLGKLQIWSQLSSLMIGRWLKTTEEYHCCVSYEKSLKNLCSLMFFLSSNHKFARQLCKWTLLCYQRQVQNTGHRSLFYIKYPKHL